MNGSVEMLFRSLCSHAVILARNYSNLISHFYIEEFSANLVPKIFMSMTKVKTGVILSYSFTPLIFRK